MLIPPPAADGAGVSVEGVVASGRECGVAVDDFRGLPERFIDGADEAIIKCTSYIDA